MFFSSGAYCQKLLAKKSVWVDIVKSLILFNCINASMQVLLEPELQSPTVGLESEPGGMPSVDYGFHSKYL